MSQPAVVELPTAGVPADNGLSSLGLIMQLGGTLLTATVGMLGIGQLMTIVQLRHTAGSTLLWTLVATALCVMRSMVHHAAGVDLLYGRRTPAGEPASPLVGLRRYIAIGTVQSVLLSGLFVWQFGTSITSGVAFAIGLAAWPLALAGMMATGKFQRFAIEVPVAEDKGFEGASVLMTIMGLCGALATGAVLVVFFKGGGEAFQGVNALLVITTGVLFVRSCLHVHAGTSGLRETSIDRSVELANRYANFGVISAFCAAGALLMFFMSMTFSFVGVLPIAALCWMLMAWPLIVRRFFSDRQFADLLSGGETIHRRAPDAGTTGLGWFLLAHAMFSAISVVPSILGTQVASDQLGMLSGGLDAAALGQSKWWGIAAWVLQAWAGFELIRMSPIHRIVGSVYGAAGAAITVYTSWPILKELGNLALGANGMLLHALLAIALILPVTTLILVNRKLSPTARARYRVGAGGTTATQA